MASLTITVNNLNKRKGPGTSYASVGKLSKGDVVNSVEKIMSGDERWYKLSDGTYICGYQASSGWYLKDTPSTPASTTDTSSSASGNAATNVTNAASTATGSGLDKAIEQMLQQNIKNGKNMIDPNTRAIGQPHQFLASTDYRNIDTIDMGRKFLESVFAEAPIVTIIPGKPNYLPDATKDEKKLLTSYFDGKGKDANSNTALAQLISGSDDCRYFGFAEDYSEYIRYVNLLCRISSIYMGLGEKKAPAALSTKYKNYNWANYKYRDASRRTNREQEGTFVMKLWDAAKQAVNDFASEITTPDYVNFYVDSNTSFNESSDNSTSQSMLESQLTNTLEGLSKELSFFLNAGGAGIADDLKNSMASAISSIGNSGITGSGGIIDRIIGTSTNIIQGSNMVFPEIWGDSDYGKSYNINMTLQSPYGNKEAIYNNIIVPMMHVLALALPRQTSANSFTSPFLIKAFSPGWFVCDMGIITGLSIEKSEWTVDGLPSEIKISFTIKDLYNQLMITKTNKPGDFFNNQSLMDFLAVTSGLNILAPNLKIKIDTITSTLVTKVLDTPSNVYQDFISFCKETYFDIASFK